ncbi:hypothetical protein [Phenylobacterium sp.]|jgi:hypothetical protein|uniref:hypothetical protein n=1 Tax=Phenylobacterium sp. TaxID=1871053 RepID=UPI002F92CB53
MFATPVGPVEPGSSVIAGPLRSPRNLLGAQTYGDHASIHDDDTARKLGFRGGTIEGPTHFSQFAPLGAALWGEDWIRRGCVSAHFRNPSYDGEEVRAFADSSTAGDRWARIWMTKPDGTEILTGSMSIGPDHPVTALDERLAGLRPLTEPLRILSEAQVGMRSARQSVDISSTLQMGDLYPFTLQQKLQVITEPSPIYAGAENSFGRATLPMEMISVLTQYDAPPLFQADPRAIGLFADQEIRLLQGPLFPDEPYELDREIVALSGSRRTESVWIRSRIYAPDGEMPLASVLLNSAYLKDSI